jgi:hypothetical protein
VESVWTSPETGLVFVYKAHIEEDPTLKPIVHEMENGGPAAILVVAFKMPVNLNSQQTVCDYSDVVTVKPAMPIPR